MKLFKIFLFLLFVLCVSANAAPGVALRIKRAGAPEAPPTPDAMAFMMDKPSRRIHNFTLDNIVPVQSGKGSRFDWYRGGWQNPIYLAEFTGNLNIQSDGNYTFEIHSSNPVYFWLNDKLILEDKEFHYRDPRKNQELHKISGEPIKLKSGSARLRIITMCRERIDLALLWKTPKSPKDFTAVATADWLESPAPASDRKTAKYSFSTIPGAFIPVTDASGEIKRADYQPGTKPLIEYRLNAEISGIPAICDENERISPEIQGSTDAPDSIHVDFEAKVITISQKATQTNTYSSTITFNKGWGRLALPVFSVRELKALNWRAAHRGITIASGTVEFMQRPYNSIPDEIRNDALYSNGIRIVPVTSQSLRTPHSALNTPHSALSIPHSALNTPHSALNTPHSRPNDSILTKDIVVLDGFISSASSGGTEIGKVFDDALTNNTTLLSYIRIKSDAMPMPGPVSFANRNLQTLLSVREIKEASTVIIAPEIKGAYFGESLAGFKNKLLAEIAFLRDVRKCEVILLTPPEGLLAEIEPHSARDYAAAIHLAADIEGAKVVDLYTLGKTGKVNYADDIRHCLNEDGVKKAAERIR